MAMEARLALRQTQRLVMTPMLQQAIQLLQLSTLELQDLLQKELTENPMLEEAPSDEAAVPEPAPDAPTVEPVQAEEERPAAEPAAETPELPFDLTDVIFGGSDERSLVQQETHDDTRFENFVGTITSLSDHLEDQVRVLAIDANARRAVEEIIGNLDEDGYLRATFEEMAERTGHPVAEFEAALAVVHGLEPPGVGARDLRECLLIQLRLQAEPDPVAIAILESQFEPLQRCRYADIARALKLEHARVVEAVEAIARLEPKPGRPFDTRQTEYLGIDVAVEKDGDDYIVLVNDDGIPRLRINALYRSLITRNQNDEARRYLDEKHRSAMWLIKSIHQRQRTLYKVTKSIVHFQKDFLDKGVTHLRPLALRDVAEDIGMHESTVSRVTTKKNVQTPQGLFPLKYFFHSGISKDQGDDVSSLSVKKMIRDLIATEAAGQALSDQDITRQLKQNGLNIARRTVAKYREELGILPSHQRRLALRKR
jgi:RNA polymerase sigma-54 factor